VSGVVQPATLEQAIGMADAVVVATPGRPPERIEMIGITPGGGPATEEYPAFRQVFHRYRIDEVLFGDAETGADIEVSPNSGGITLETHRLYYVKKINKILLHLDYRTSLTPADEKTGPGRILLLRKAGDGWAFAYGMSVEPLRLRGKIEAMLASRKDESA
jgi:hypothetical protein